MMPISFGVQLYTVRNFLQTEDAVRSALSKIRAIGYETVQACCPMEAVSYKRLGELASECGLSVCGTFDSLKSMLNTPALLAKNTKLLGTTNAGIGYLSLANDCEVEQAVADLNRAAENLNPFGLSLHYHNHAHEFSKYKGKLIIDHLAAETDVKLCPDTYWIQTGGGDVRHFIRTYADRISILHLKDYAYVNHASRFASVGSGNLYWDGIIKEAKDCGISHFVVEQDDCYGTDPFEALANSMAFLEKYR